MAAAFDAPSASAAVTILNGLVAELGTPPQLELQGERWEFRSWPVEPPGLDTAVAIGAIGLLAVIRDLGWRRLGRCAGSPCRCVYVDRSRNRSRRFCCTLCADRIAQASSRHRRAESSSRSAPRSAA